MGEDGSTPSFNGESSLYLPSSMPGFIKWGWCIEIAAAVDTIPAVDEIPEV